MNHAPAEPVEDIEIQLLLEALYLRYHYDFRHYARASIKRLTPRIVSLHWSQSAAIV